MNTEKHLADALREAFRFALNVPTDSQLDAKVGAMGGATARSRMAAWREALEAYDAQAAVPANVVFAWGERSALSGGLPLVTMTQQGPDRFTVRYGMEVRARLSYSSACTALGAAIMHALACDSLIDNRTKAEARRDGDA